MTKKTGVWLQWSRFFSKRKIGNCRAGADVGDEASMEPLFFKAENIGLIVGPSGSGKSFNGAAFFQSGKFGVCIARLAGTKASMEPLFFKAENSQPLNSSNHSASGFNGAAFFQSGKSTFRAKSLPPPGGLQWSRFFSKRKIGQDELAVTLLVASMEPLFFKAENNRYPVR